jgi:hypothetical protein
MILWADLHDLHEVGVHAGDTNIQVIATGALDPAAAKAWEYYV